MDHNNYIPQVDQHGATYPDMMMLEAPVSNPNKMAGGAVYICNEDNMQMGDGPPMGYQMEDPMCAAMMGQQQMLHQQPMAQDPLFSAPMEDHWGSPHVQLDHSAHSQYYGGGGAMDPAQVGYPASAAMMGPEAGTSQSAWHPDADDCDGAYRSDMAGEESEEHMQQEAWERRRRERRRELNRAAATRCRERKLQRIRSLQDRVTSLRAETERMMRTAQVLRTQVHARRERVRVHERAGCLMPLPPRAARLRSRSPSPLPDGADVNHPYSN